MAMGTPHHPLGAVHAAHDLTEHRGVFLGERVPYGVGQIDRCGAFGDGHLHHLAEIVPVGAAGVLGGELDVVSVGASLPDRATGKLEGIFPGHPEFVLQVEIGC